MDAESNRINTGTGIQNGEILALCQCHIFQPELEQKSGSKRFAQDWRGVHVWMCVCVCGCGRGVALGASWGVDQKVALLQQLVNE
jgi:hypothetical protein